MSKFFLFLIGLSSLISCSDIESNSPALQGLQDNILLRTEDQSAAFNDDGSLVIRGVRGGASINFILNSATTSQVDFGGETAATDVAVFVNSEGVSYSTNFENASGELNFTIENGSSISGDFMFTAYTASQEDEVLFSRGVMFNVPIVGFVPIDIPGGPVENRFFASINGSPFEPTLISRPVVDGIITVSGETSSIKIELNFPVDSPPGLYELVVGTPSSASFINQNSVNESISGLLEITTNDTDRRIMAATFSFETEGVFSITNGEFVVNY